MAGVLGCYGGWDGALAKERVQISVWPCPGPLSAPPFLLSPLLVILCLLSFPGLHESFAKHPPAATACQVHSAQREDMGYGHSHVPPRVLRLMLYSLSERPEVGDPWLSSLSSSTDLEADSILPHISSSVLVMAPKVCALANQLVAECLQ